MSTHREILRKADEVVERARAAGRLDRRAFLRLSTVGIGATVLAACNSPGPRSAEQLLTFATRQNEKFERWLLGRSTLARTGGVPPAGARFPTYWVSKQVPVWNEAAMGVWRLEVNGAVKTPRTFTFDELRALPTVTQRVPHYCVEGWTAVADFTGVPMRALLAAVQPTGDAAFVDFASFDDGYHESWDMESVLHPQTMLVLAKDGRRLSPAYGAPARVHGPVKLGYKNTKYLTKIVVLPRANGGYWSDRGYEWYGGT
ncbi:MAG: molybdopterin-dependent oxidoreductase [Gemmatimonadota bacterium]